MLPARLRSRLLVAAASLSLFVPIGLAVLPAEAAGPDVGSAAGPSPTPTMARRTVTLVGDLQDDLGCPTEWDQTCTVTDLTKDATGNTYSGEFVVPAGRSEYKVAINHAWDESYGPDGGGGNGAFALEHEALLRFVYDDTAHTIAVFPTDLSTAVTADDKAMAVNKRLGLTKERFYFVMADRFANGSKANDKGGLTGGRLETGLDPTDKGFYHGGDLLGLTGKLDYIKGLGTTAIWLTPAFVNRPVQGSPANASAGYHGYWITDFTRIDPHLGSNADMKKLIKEAHKRKMKVFFDIITNHTADILDYTDPAAGGSTPYSYISKTTKPYRDASGNEFDDTQYAGGDTFPALDPATSFPYTPKFRTTADATVKVPSWLNDPTRYHNRGNSTFSGESAEYGDFSGLDDLFTEQPAVVEGMTDIYKAWVDFGIDGFRIDTVKHVNLEFWQKFSPAILAEAAKVKNPDFFMFGEVFDGNPAFMSRYTTSGRLPATLDFGFQATALQLAEGKSPLNLKNLFLADDYYTDADSNVYESPTFLGNHDIGRLAYLLTKDGITDPASRLARVEFANKLMFVSRGQPVTYYGDEQGFIGLGGDQAARQDQFATQTEQYATEVNLFGASAAGAKNRYGTGTPLYKLIKQLSALRKANPALANGSQTMRYASADAGVLAFSRLDAGKGVEYIVAVNNATEAKSATFDTFSPSMAFRPIYGTKRLLRSRSDARITVRVPALGVAVWKATGRTLGSTAAPTVILRHPGSGADFTGRARISAALNSRDFAEVTFAWRPVGETAWTKLGTDDNAPYAVYHDVSALPTGTMVEYRAIAKDIRGRYRVDVTYGNVGDKGIPATDGGGLGPVTQPTTVAVAGTLDSELGCTGDNAGDWQPWCDQAQMTLDANSAVWKKSVHIPSGPYAYKIAINRSWDENYGAGGAFNGPNIDLVVPPSGDVTFYYDHRSHSIQDSTHPPFVVAAGDFQSELGCSADRDPACLRTWLTDKDGDGIYTWEFLGVPVGTWNFKVALNFTSDVSYGNNGGASDMTFNVPEAGKVVSIEWDSATHIPTVSISEPVGTIDLGTAKAYWVPDSCYFAWPSNRIAAGEVAAGLRWVLHASVEDDLSFDAQRIYSDRSFALTYAGQIPGSVAAAYPALAGYLALTLDDCTPGRVEALSEQYLAIGQYDDLLKLRDGTGVQFP